MASKKSIAIRVDAALTRIAEALGDGVRVRHKDPDIRQALQLEAIADAVTASALVVGVDDVGTTANDDASALPDDFPGRDALIASDITTIDAVRAVANLTAITGIGKATAAAITEALAALAPAPTGKPSDDGQQPDASTTATNDDDPDGAGDVSSTATNDGAAA